MPKARAEGTVFETLFDRVSKIDVVHWFDGRAHALTRVRDGKVPLTPEMLDALFLKQGDRLLVIKGAAVAMSFVPVEIWEDRLAERGFNQAVENIGKLEEFQ